MKKNLFLRLLLSAITAIPLISCRNDHFSEPETYNNSSQFQITSRVIPLQESKHKTKLLPELSKAQDNLKKFSPGLHGKTIDYGNGISINTDHVIYIENGPDYHTYTFKVDRADAPEDAPLENLVLSPLKDGTYRELLITYYLSPQEKEILTNGGTVDAKGKLSVMEIGTTAFNPLTAKSQDCQWVDNSFYTTCSEGLHSHGEQSPTCVAGVKSMLVTDIQLQCQDVGDGSDGTGGYFGSGGGGGSGGSGGGSGGGTGTGTGNNNGGTGNNTSPCPNGGILTGPQDITTDFGDGNCSGIPTQINLPRPNNTPCQKAQPSIDAANAILHDNTVKQKMDDVLKGKVQAPKEWSVALGQNPNGFESTSAIEQNTTDGQAPSSQLSSGSTLIGDGHSHAGGAGNPSGGDLYHMLEELFAHGNLNFKYRYVYGISNNGTTEVYALVINDIALAQQFWNDYPMSENYDPTNHTIKEGSKLWKEVDKMKIIYKQPNTINTSGEYYDVRAIGMAYVFDQYNAGISIAKVDANGNLKKINASLENNGATEQKAKVSKCP